MGSACSTVASLLLLFLLQMDRNVTEDGFRDLYPLCFRSNRYQMFMAGSSRMVTLSAAVVESGLLGMNNELVWI